MDKYLTTNDVAEVLGVNYYTALRMIHDRIPHLKINSRNVRVKESDLQAWIDESTCCPHAVIVPPKRRMAALPSAPYLNEDGTIPSKRPKIQPK